MSSKDIYFIQVKGGNHSAIEQVASEMGDISEDNVVITGELIEPVDRDEIEIWIKQLARELDITLE